MVNKKLPNASVVLVLGILSICFCAAWGIPGLVLGIIALVLYKKDKLVYNTNPVAYEASFKNSNAGKICAIVGVSLSAFTFLFILIYFVIIGSIFAGVLGTINEAVKFNKLHENYYDSNTDESITDSIFLIDNFEEIEDSSKINY